jgi:hypothetical protein
MSKMRTSLVINGIMVSETVNGVGAIYTVFDNKADVGDMAFDKNGEFLSKEDSLYAYFKSREEQLTKKYGHLFCPKHSRLLYNGKCDVCTGTTIELICTM